MPLVEAVPLRRYGVGFIPPGTYVCVLITGGWVDGIAGRRLGV